MGIAQVLLIGALGLAIVLARVTLDTQAASRRPMRLCGPGDLCPVALVSGVEPTLWVVAQQAGPNYLAQALPEGEAVVAFRLLENEVEYLGPGSVAAGNLPWSVRDVSAFALPGIRALTLYAVNGWLVQTSPPYCPAPPQNGTDDNTSYWCGGAFVTGTGDDPQPDTIDIRGGALHVQWNAYENFAPDPRLGNPWSEPRHGIYVVRPNGCPANVMGECPVWEMVGRLEPSMGASPSPTFTSASPTPSQSALAPGPRLDPSITRPSSADLLGLPEGSLVLARVTKDEGGTALSISALSPSGEEQAIGDFAVPDSLRLLPEPLDRRTAAGRLGPTGYLALAGFKGDSTGEVWIYDLSDPQVPPRGPYPSAHFAWSPRGLISIVSPYGDARVLVVDPTDGTSWHVRPELDRGVGYLWNRDGTSWLAVDTRDEQSFRLGMVSALDGLFQQSTNPGLAFVDGSYLTAEYSAAGEAISTVAIDGDVGPVVLKTGPAGQSDSLSGGTIWFDGRTDEAMPLWVGWDTDGVGLLAVFDEEGQLVLARFDAPGERQTLGVLDPGPSDPASGVQAIHQVPGASRPDVLLEFANRGTTVWFSGVTGESRVVSSSADQTIFGGWILATAAPR